ncbi:hypothetical protein DsansV1_C19g0157181 [Dioscorea sansibarensis]
MALSFLATKPLHFLLLIFFIARANLSTCTTTTTTTTATATPLLKGSVSCLDCTSLQDLSGVKVAVSCSHTGQVISSLTNKKGEFEVKLPSSSSSSPKCVATLLGCKVQLCAFRKDMVSKLVKPQGSPSNSFVLTTPLNFFSTSCPSRTVHAPTMHQKLDDHDRSSSSSSSPSTPDNIPQPYPWGLPPPCYFCHFLPIIGIP